ncbi:MAG: CDC27 family protein [Anaerolineae bacterium]|nr:CDC27 family protein [Anaerolineae bacterium]
MNDLPPNTGDVTQGVAILDNLGDKIAPPDPYADDVSAAWQLHLSNKNEQALAAFEKVLQQDADHMDALYGKALALVELGRNDEAIAAFEKTVSLISNIRADMPGRSAILERLAKRQISWLQQRK